MMKPDRRAPRDSSLVRPTPERRRHGKIETMPAQIADERGMPARPFRAVDTLMVMERRGSITPGMRQAADDFRRDFHIAGLHALRAAPLERLGSGAPSLSHMQLDARRRVHRAMTALGGLSSPAGSCLWHVVALEQTLHEWATHAGWNGRPLAEKTAAGILIAALGCLASEMGYS